MSHRPFHLVPARLALAIVLLGVLLGSFLAPAAALAAKIDIPGPPGSGTFGTEVHVLPFSGNILVVDQAFSGGAAASTGAVYVHDPDGVAISRLEGSAAGGAVGSGGVKVLDSGHYIVLSPAVVHDPYWVWLPVTGRQSSP